ncbi:MAG: 5'-nucleotidase C-terminal domain-containing protein [Bacteroidetes bacterium]|nr:5'-nucleotidase C-terminal domain-containing protein [Bacteroidota bacterium]
MNRLKIFLLCICVIAAACSPKVKLKKIEHNIFGLTSSEPAGVDSAAIKMISPYKTAIDSEMNEIIGTSAVVMTKGEPEGLLGNFVADLTLFIARRQYRPDDSINIDFCFLNNGGLRRDLPQGKINKGIIFELMPFENTLVILTLSGQNTYDLIRRIAAMGGMPVAGIRFGIKDKNPVSITLDSKPFDLNRNYKIVTSDYLAEGGENFSFLKNPVRYETIGIKLRDAIIEYILMQTGKGNELNPTLDGRIYYEK